MKAKFIGHTSSRCDVDNSAKMQLRIVHSPDSSSRGSYPSWLSLSLTASSRAPFVRACRLTSSPRLVPTAVATSCSDSALPARRTACRQRSSHHRRRECIPGLRNLDRKSPRRDRVNLRRPPRPRSNPPGKPPVLDGQQPRLGHLVQVKGRDPRLDPKLLRGLLAPDRLLALADVQVKLLPSRLSQQPDRHKISGIHRRPPSPWTQLCCEPGLPPAAQRLPVARV